jgi:hypothetical protein
MKITPMVKIANNDFLLRSNRNLKQSRKMKMTKAEATKIIEDRNIAIVEIINRIHSEVPNLIFCSFISFQCSGNLQVSIGKIILITLYFSVAETFRFPVEKWSA